MRYEGHGDGPIGPRLDASRGRIDRIVGHLAELVAHVLELRVVVEDGLDLLLVADGDRAKVHAARYDAQENGQGGAGDGQLGAVVAVVAAQEVEVEEEGIVAARRRLQGGREAAVRVLISMKRMYSLSLLFKDNFLQNFIEFL